MSDIKNTEKKLKTEKQKEKRRAYMREYYRKKKNGIVKPKKKKQVPQFKITRGNFIVHFD